MLELNKIYCGDCLDLMPEIDDKSIDLIISDTPYNIKKADWDRIPNYIEWMGKIFKGYERILKDNGSFYQFHNKMPIIARLMIWLEDNTDFVFKQFITWNKRFDNYWNQLNAVIMEDLRNYSKQCEYLLFYVFQDETGLEKIKSKYESFITIKRYLNREREKYEKRNGKIKDILKWTKHQHSFIQGKGFSFPTKETYMELQAKTGFFKKSYEKLYCEYKDLRREYEDLRREYEDLRYTFNNQKTHHSVWNYEIAERNEHKTPKPIDLIKNIILHSTNEGDLVFDGFMGSGTTADACKELNRNFIGFEIANKRIKQERQQLKLEFA